MKKVLLASACLFALAAPASAADLAARPYTKAPVAVASVYNWTGFYLGIVGGGAWENGSGDPKMKGGFVGGTAGYNWQTCNVVFGVEAFFAPQWSVKGEYLYRSLGGETYFSGALPTATLNFHTVQVGVNYHFGGPVVAKY